MFKNIQPITQYQLITITAIFLVFFANTAFIKNVVEVYPLTIVNTSFLISLLVALTTLMVLVLTLLSSRYTTKPLLMIFLIISALTNYFTNSFDIVFNDGMIRSVIQTNVNEFVDLLSYGIIWYLLFLGILPSVVIYKLPLKVGFFKSEALSKLKTITFSFGILLFILLSFSKVYTSFFKEHTSLHYYSNPTYPIYSAFKLAIDSFDYTTNYELKAIGEDATINNKSGKNKLVIIVVGEAARADHFSLNGYKYETNPLLKQEDVINFSNVYSCSTSTAISVPCMFSMYDRVNYTDAKAQSTENVLDVLKRTGEIAIFWRDNNSDSKGVANRVLYEDFKNSTSNTIFDVELKDEEMLTGLDKYIEKNKQKNILIVLHQMGSHGPAYYKRYPKSFEKFKPACKTNQIKNCSQDELSNAYDNTILYTDYFLSKTINFLKAYSKTYETSMIYMSDHGQSLGENGVYLHGLPYDIAPQNQKHIATLMWFGDEKTKVIDLTKLKSYSNEEFSHDNLFHTLLGIFNVSTDIYKKEKDILAPSQKGSELNF